MVKQTAESKAWIWVVIALIVFLAITLICNSQLFNSDQKPAPRPDVTSVVHTR